MFEEVSQRSLFQFVFFLRTGSFVFQLRLRVKTVIHFLSSPPALDDESGSWVSWGRRDVRCSSIFRLQAQFISFGTTNGVLNEGYG